MAIIHNEKIEIFSSSEFKQHKFGIGEEATILNFLRSKIYSNPIRAICQEIISNARDAHREVGTPKRPVVVIFPNKFESSCIKFVDYGPGISPTRMEEIYTKYGMSTKRDSNVQAGQWGLGCKSPFAYTDSFNITTTSKDSDGIKRKRVYAAIIDNSRVGAVNLLSTTEVPNEECGTEILIPVDKKDVRSFITETLDVTRCWGVKPIIYNCPDNLKNRYWAEAKKSIFHGDNWAIYSIHCFSNQSYVYLDEIPYKLDIPLLRSKINGETEKKILKTHFSMSFNTGELAVTISRESLDYQQHVIDKIQERLSEITKFIVKNANNSLKSAKSYKEAVLLWEKSKSYLAFFGIKPKWNGHKLKTQSFSFADRCKNGKTYIYTKNTSYAAGISCNNTTRYKFPSIGNNFCAIFVEDDTVGTRKPPIAKIRRLLDNKPDGTTIEVAKPFGQLGRKELEDNLNWSLLNPIKLSSIEDLKLKRTSNRKGTGNKRVAIKYLKRGKWIDSDKEFNSSGIYVPLYRNNAYFNSEIIRNFDIKNIQLIFNIRVFGVFRRSIKKLSSNWITLESFLKEEKIRLSRSDLLAHAISLGPHGGCTNYYNNNLIKSIYKLVGKKSIFAKWVDESNLYQSQRNEIKRWALINRYFGDTRFVQGEKLRELREKCYKRYPLLQKILGNVYTSNLKSDFIREIAFYIKQKDRHAKIERIGEINRRKNKNDS